jgi:EmrB/QacA subfamily drug resistance transporter
MKTPSSKYAIALTAALGLFMAVLDNTIVNVSLTPMASSLKTDLRSIQWVVTAYFLAQAAIIPVAGYFSIRFGIKRLFIICLGLFTIGSFLCGISQDQTMLIAFRVLQGLGGGALFPLGQAIALQAFPPEERAASSAVIGIPVLLAPAFGPTIGGLITDSLGWEYIFFINVPVGAIAIFLAIRVFPADKVMAAKNRSFDYIGLVLSILGVLLVVYAFTVVSDSDPSTITPLNQRGTIHGWGYWEVWLLLGVGLALLAAFAFYETRISKDPVLDLRLFARYEYTIASLVTWVVSVVVFGSIFLLPVFLEQVRVPNLNALGAGLAMMPQGLAAGVAVAMSGRLYNKLGPRWLVVIGAVLLIFSSWQLSNLQTDTDGLWLLPWLIVRGLGFGLTAIPAQTLALQAITGPDLPKASSLFNVTRQIFSSIGIAVLTTLFVQQTASHATELQAAAAASGAAAPNLATPAGRAAFAQLQAKAGTSGMNDVFVIVALGTIIVVLLALALPNKPRRAKVAAGEEETTNHPVMAME